MVMTVIALSLKGFEKIVFACWRQCIEGERIECMAENKAFDLNIDCKHLFLNDVTWMINNSYCSTTHSLINIYVNFDTQWIVKFFFYLFPIWAFFLFNDPHDCFRCLGKDPDRIFSIKQYNRDEF